MTARQQIEVGCACEQFWHKIAEREALTTYEQQPHVKDARAEQDITNSIPPSFRGKDRLKEITEEMDDIFDHGSRWVTLPLSRRHGQNDRIIRAVVRWYRQTQGVKVSEYRVKICWSKYRRNPMRDFLDDLMRFMRSCTRMTRHGCFTFAVELADKGEPVDTEALLQVIARHAGKT